MSRLAALPLFVVLTAALSLGLGLLLAALTVKYRDFRYVVPFVVQLGLFVSPVAFVTSQVPERWRAVYALNPMVGIIDGFRWAILGTALDPAGARHGGARDTGGSGVGHVVFPAHRARLRRCDLGLQFAACSGCHHVIVTAERLGKRYRLRHQQRERLCDAARRHRGRRRHRRWRGSTAGARGAGATEDFWALRDVSFEVAPGEVVGIIGRNGAGKSTLLKILSRITEPTTGRVTLDGRVASLLEVGTGFHPELTGRENIFLNGAILGMTRAEIRRKFDEIVAFAEVERFLDTPVKRYSSGMYVRLAFAVAAHLEPEILVVDEVLAVGDAEFQKKCLGKMHEVSRGGRTVLFVSHNMAAVQALCSRAIWLERGEVAASGPASAVVAQYLQGTQSVDRDLTTSNTAGRTPRGSCVSAGTRIR